MSILAGEEDEEGFDQLIIMERLFDSAQMMAIVFQKLTDTRRAFISPRLNKTVRDTLDETKVDSFLYGADLKKSIRSLKDSSKITSELKSPVPKQEKKKTFLGNKGYQPYGQRYSNHQEQWRPRFSFKGKPNQQCNQRPRGKPKPQQPKTTDK